ncbi:MAG: hypothetical protein ACREIC_28135, partial [Limisphaerales bacterium]
MNTISKLYLFFFPKRSPQKAGRVTFGAGPLRCALGLVFAAFAGGSCICTAAPDGRQTVSLDGWWQIDESVSAEEQPSQFRHRVPVPGLVHLAKPAFPDVDDFQSQELIANRIRRGELPETARVQTPGITRQSRNYFWYRKDFEAGVPRAAAILKINKAQFGTAVWLNGQRLGEYSGCFSASYFNLTGAIHWHARNELLIRVGAHPAVLPVSYPAGTDFEKLKWTPGIYDSVSVYFCDNPVIESIQVAPRLDTCEVVVQTRMRNYGARRAVVLDQRVKPFRASGSAIKVEPLKLELEAGEEKVVRQRIAIPNPRLWSPEDPFLYLLETSTGGDNVTTRFGMREFHSDSRSQRFYLNGKPYYLRGSNITLHRFFEDPDCGDLPWNEAWVRKLLIQIPKRMHWNAFRFCIGPVPD